MKLTNLLIILVIFFSENIFAFDIKLSESSRLQLADSLANFDFYVTGIDSNGIESFIVIDPGISSSNLKRVKEFNDKFKGSDITLVRLPFENRQLLFNKCRSLISSSIELEKDYVKRPLKELEILRILKNSALSIHWFLNSTLGLDRFYVKFFNVQENKDFIFLDFQLKQILSNRIYKQISENYKSSKNYTIDDKTAYQLLKENEARLNDLFSNKELSQNDSIFLSKLRKSYLQLANENHK